MSSTGSRGPEPVHRPLTISPTDLSGSRFDRHPNIMEAEAAAGAVSPCRRDRLHPRRRTVDRASRERPRRPGRAPGPRAVAPDPRRGPTGPGVDRRQGRAGSTAAADPHGPPRESPARARGHRDASRECSPSPVTRTGPPRFDRGPVRATPADDGPCGAGRRAARSHPGGRGPISSLRRSPLAPAVGRDLVARIGSPPGAKVRGRRTEISSTAVVDCQNGRLEEPAYSSGKTEIANAKRPSKRIVDSQANRIHHCLIVSVPNRRRNRR